MTEGIIRRLLVFRVDILIRTGILKVNLLIELKVAVLAPDCET